MAPVPRGGFRFPCMNLRDEVGDDETHPLAALMEVIGTLIEKYEDEHVPELTAV
jgi:HTH-type transcriptional regulator / antitoxin HigA